MKTYIDEFIITLATFVSNTGQVRVPLLAILSNNLAVVVLVLTQEPLWVVVRVNVDFGEGIVSGWFIDTFVDTGLQPRQKQLQSVSLLDLFNELVCGELTSDDHDQLFDGILTTIHVQQTTYHNWQTRWVHLKKH